jgi:hypothetical protein
MGKYPTLLRMGVLGVYVTVIVASYEYNAILSSSHVGFC